MADAFHKKYEDKRNEVAGVTPEVEGPSVYEMLHGEDEKFFGMYLDQMGESELSDRILQGEEKISDEDISNIAWHRESFLNLKKREKELNERLDQDMGSLIKVSPELGKITGLVGAEGVKLVAKFRLMEMAIKDQPRFDQLYAEHMAAAAVEEEMAAEHKIVQKMCEKYGFTEDEYVAALNSGDDRAIFKELEKLVRGRRGIWKEATATTADLNAETASLNRRYVIEGHIYDLNGRLREMAQKLALAFHENEALGESLAAVNRGEASIEQTVTFEETSVALKEVLKTPMDTPAVRARCKQYLDARKNEPDYDADVALDGFVAEEYKRDYASKLPQKKKSWWSLGFETLISKRLREVV